MRLDDVRPDGVHLSGMHFPTTSPKFISIHLISTAQNVTTVYKFNYMKTQAYWRASMLLKTHERIIKQKQKLFKMQSSLKLGFNETLLGPVS
jgi:hypothetical protein